MMVHPYTGLDDFRFWSRAMSDPAPGHIDPVTRSSIILPSDKVATMGSCFAQHLAKHIASIGLNYFVAEHAPAGLAEQAARQRNYGVFSARYGNVYTVRQAVQLFDRAFGRFVPVESAWQRSDGRWVDPFRPQVEPDGFASPAEVQTATAAHLPYVRRVFSDAHWFIFTLGLTEAWRSRRDGAVFPMAPGVSGGAYDPDLHEFVNFTQRETSDDLDALIDRIASVNPQARILLTVSPVPLIATYEPRHVLVSTTCSKAILRVAADEAERKHPHVVYFPSYEIITSPAAGGRYFQEDLRQVTDIGVSHVMRIFSRHFVEPESADSTIAPALGVTQSTANVDVVCDEEAIEAAIKASQGKAKVPL